MQDNADMEIIAANRKLQKASQSLAQARKRVSDVAGPSPKRPRIHTPAELEILHQKVSAAENARQKALQRSEKLLGSGSGIVKITLPEFVEGRSSGLNLQPHTHC